MRTGRAILTLLLAATFALLLTTCTFELSVPQYSLEFRGKTAYASPTTASVEFRYTAEESVHRCRLLVTDSFGATVSEQTGEFTAGVWHTVGCNLPAEGRYSLRVVVQVRASDGGYVDLPFLDKSVYLYVDLTDPVAPTIDPTPLISSGPVSVTLEHPELSNPTGSPVALYYTLDGGPPGPSSLKYAGSPIVLPPSETPTTLKVVAIDAAEHASAVQSHCFPFMNILTAMPKYPPLTVNGGPQYVYLDGYGLGAIDDVRLYDSDTPEGILGGSVAETGLTSERTDTHMRISVDPAYVVFGPEPFNWGWGFVWVKDNETGETDTIAIYVDP